ncbi:MAG: hypothetical protein ACREF5_02270 [Candidatus Saccharimonadales bacterium]
MSSETDINKLVREQANSLQPEKHETTKTQAVQSPDRLGFLTLKATGTHSEAIPRLKHTSPEAALNLSALLETSEKITVGDTTLRKVFETKLISERGLRRAVVAYQGGGDVRRILAEELLIKEIGFELDPQLRDRPIRSGQILSEKVKKYEPKPGDIAKLKDDRLDSEDVTTPDAPSKSSTRSKTRSILIRANIAASIVLLVLVLVLLLTRK